MLFQQNRPPVQSDAASYQPSLQLNKLLLKMQFIFREDTIYMEEKKHGISGVVTQNSRILKRNLPHKVLKDSYRKIGRITNQRSAYTLARYLDTGL